MKKISIPRVNFWFTLFVIIPVVIAALYYGLMASDQFVSESRFIVKGRSNQSTPLTGIASLVQATGLSAGQEQTNEVLDYLKSRNALSELQHKLNIKSHYAQTDIDLLSRYPALLRPDRFENLFSYYSDKIDTKIDPETGLAVLRVRAFSPNEAKHINSVLLDLSEALVNRLNVKAREKAIFEAERNVSKAESRVRQARIGLTQYRNSQALIDPLKQASGVLAISDKFAADRAALQAQLDVMMRVAPRNPSIPALQRRIAATSNAIAVQNGRAVGSPSALSSKVGSYENLMLEQEFGAQALTATNSTLEQARAEAQRQQFYLERVVEPNAPDISRYPQRLWKIFTVAGVALCFYLIGWMLVVGILEHSPED